MTDIADRQATAEGGGQGRDAGAGSTVPSVSLYALATIPMILPGVDLAKEILAAADREAFRFRDSDIVVVAQKVVSKAEARTVQLAAVEPSARARALAAETGKDARLVEAILGESVEVMRARRDLLIVEHRLGHVMANAGIDRSNVGPAASEDMVLLLPADPDASAAGLRRRLEEATGLRLGVIISDSFGRAWRRGTVGTAIGTAGPPMVVDRRGDPDMCGRPLEVTMVGFADGVAAAAVLAMGEGAESRPVVVVRGLNWSGSGQTSRDVIRPRAEDVFR